MITLKTKRIIDFVIETFLVFFLILSFTTSVYVVALSYSSKEIEVETIIEGSSSTILDINGNSITTLNLVNTNSVTYEDLPDVFINALISAEDARFFVHSGIDFQRILDMVKENDEVK